MSVKNSKNKKNNLQKPLPNAVTIFFFFKLFIKISLIYVNIKPDKKTLHINE